MHSRVHTREQGFKGPNEYGTIHGKSSIDLRISYLNRDFNSNTIAIFLLFLYSLVALLQVRAPSFSLGDSPLPLSVHLVQLGSPPCTRSGVCDPNTPTDYTKPLNHRDCFREGKKDSREYSGALGKEHFFFLLN